MSDDRDQLLLSVCEARKNSTGRTGLAAQRRIQQRGDVEWFVAFWPETSFMTVLSDSLRCDEMSDEAVADFILACWDSDWDDRQVEHPVGDFRLGSSDFKQVQVGD